MARTAILCRRQMASGLTGGDRTVMALRTARVLRWERDVAYRPETAVIHRREGKTPAGRVTVAAALACSRSMNIYEDLRSGRRALNGERDSRSRRIDETPRMRAIVAVRAHLARDSRTTYGRRTRPRTSTYCDNCCNRQPWVYDRRSCRWRSVHRDTSYTRWGAAPIRRDRTRRPCCNWWCCGRRHRPA